MDWGKEEEEKGEEEHRQGAGAGRKKGRDRGGRKMRSEWEGEEMLQMDGFTVS